jgi:hypothetical protein
VPKTVKEALELDRRMATPFGLMLSQRK